MSGFLKFLVVAALGVFLGYLSARHIAAGNAFSGAVRAGAWVVWPRAGSPDASPYSRLHFFLAGQAPPSHFNRLDFEADADDAGRPLKTSCAYRLEGPMPPVRWWALSLYPADEDAAARKERISEISSFDAIADADGRLRIHIDALARPGNWLKPPVNGRMILMLRLFNAAPLSREKLLTQAPFRIIREECR